LGSVFPTHPPLARLKDPDFFAFYRSTQAYETGLKGGGTRMVLSPKSDFFRFFGSPNGPPATPSPAAPAVGRGYGHWQALPIMGRNAVQGVGEALRF